MLEGVFYMKLRKAYIYLLGFICQAALFCACYYLSYRHALDEFNKRAVERVDELAGLREAAVTPAPRDNEADAVPANIQAKATVKPGTRYILEIYDMKTDTTVVEELNPPGHFVGLTKEEIEEWLEDYMEDLTLSEYNKGLIDFELVSFSDKEFRLKKTYNEDFVPFRFYVVVKNGYVVVYNSDLKSVHTYTNIEARNLSEEDRIALTQGIYVNSAEELYALLESFSS
jgi:hypothetical protein